MTTTPDQGDTRQHDQRVQVGHGDHGQVVERSNVDARFAEYRWSGDRRLRDELVMAHRWVAEHCVRRYRGKGERTEDLLQVALLGLVKAVDRFDPSRGAAFSTFAVPTITGELRRHFRDKTWPVHVPRRAKDNNLLVADVTEELTQLLRRSPTVKEVAERAGLSEEEVLEALEADASYRGVPLASGEDDSAPEDMSPRLSRHDRGFGAVDARVTLERIIHILPARERHILTLRYVEGLTQTQIGAQVGVSQVQVSRLIRDSLAELRRHLTTGESRQ
jgi:RNA polymerase sigma-B factor